MHSVCFSSCALKTTQRQSHVQRCVSVLALALVCTVHVVRRDGTGKARKANAQLVKLVAAAAAAAVCPSCNACRWRVPHIKRGKGACTIEIAAQFVIRALHVGTRDRITPCGRVQCNSTEYNISGMCDVRVRKERGRAHGVNVADHVWRRVLPLGQLL